MLCKECGKTDNSKNIYCSYCGNPLYENIWQKTLLIIQKNIKLLTIIFIVIATIFSLVVFILHRNSMSNIIGTWYNSKSPYTYIPSTIDLTDTLGSLYNENTINEATYSIEDYIIFKPNGVCEFYMTWTNIETKETNTKTTTFKYKLNFNGTKIKFIGYQLPTENEDTYFPISNNTIKFEFYYNGSIATFGEYIKK